MPKAYFNGKELIGGSGTAFTTDDTLNLSEDNVLGVSIPVNGVISQEDFDTLPPEKQNRGMWLVQGKDQPLQGVTIEEYDTTVDGCDWYVRKWSDGYAEMFGLVDISVLSDSWTAWGELFVSTANTTEYSYPFKLVRLLSQQVNAVDNSPSASVFSLTSASSAPLERVGRITLLRGTAITTTHTYRLFFMITGRWK